MNQPKVLALSFCLLALPAGASAQTTVRLGVDDAVRRGLEASHRLVQVEARRTASERAADARAAEGRPVVSLLAGYARTNHIDEFALPDPTSGRPVTLYADVPDSLSTRIDLRWPIYTGGRTDALERAARMQASAIAHEREAAQADLKFEVTRSYWSLVTAEASVAVLQQSLARLDAHLAAARARQQAGTAPPTDVLSTEAQRSRQDMLLIEARNLAETIRVDLRRLMALPADAVLVLESALQPPQMPAVDAGALVEQARTGTPDRSILADQVLGAQYLRDAARAGKLPSVAVNGGYDYARPNPLIFPRLSEFRPSWDVSVRLQWSLWDSGRVAAQEAEAVANQQAARAGLMAFDANLDADIRQHRLSLDSAMAAITAAESAVRSATEARRVMAERYSAGLSTNTDSLDAQVALLQAELDRTRAIANARLASSRLDRALGR